MGETTPPPDDRFPKVFSMTAAAYQPAGARGGFVKQQQEVTEAETEGRAMNVTSPPPPLSEPQEEGRWNKTGDGVEMATESPTRSSDESGTAVKVEKTVIGKTLADEQQGYRRTTSIYISER